MTARGRKASGKGALRARLSLGESQRVSSHVGRGERSVRISICAGMDPELILFCSPVLEGDLQAIYGNAGH